MSILTGIISFCIFFTSCSQIDEPEILTPKVRVIAHRGFWQSRGAAQNSIVSLENAEGIGVYGAEFDVHLTADSVPIVFHDITVKKMKIQEINYAAIQQIALANGEKIPTLREYLEAARRTKRIRLILELKPHATPQRNRLAARMVVDLVREKKLQHRTDYISFNLDAAREFIRLAPEAEVYYLNGELSPEQLKQEGFAGLDYHYSVMRKNRQWFNDAKRLGLGINIWTVNDTTLMREMIDAGVDFITTDIPVKALKFIQK